MAGRVGVGVGPEDCGLCSLGDAAGHAILGSYPLLASTSHMIMAAETKLCVCVCVCVCVYVGSVVSDCVTPWTESHQHPLSMGFPRQEYWSGCHFILQGIFPTQGSNPSPVL